MEGGSAVHRTLVTGSRREAEPVRRPPCTDRLYGYTSRVTITLDDVAREAGVSRMTVSNAYNQPDRLAPATLERVLAAAGRLGYGGPSAVGRSLRRGRTGV